MKSTLVALLTALLVALSVFSVPPVAAGTAALPEVIDAAGDQIEPNTGESTCLPTGCQFTNGDLLAMWIDNETATSIQVHIQITGSGAPTNTNAYTWNAYMTIGGTAYTGTVMRAIGATNPVDSSFVGGEITVAGVATNATITTGDTAATPPVPGLISFTVSRAAVGNPAVGATIGSLYADAQGALAGELPDVEDRAPDGAEFGLNYTFTMGPGGPIGGANDSDNDGLNDTFEQENFGDLNQTGSGDQDNDGLTNLQEQSLGTDPTMADTDGDGAGDKTEVDAGTDPTDPTSTPGTGNPPPPPPPGPNPPPPPGPNPPPPPPPVTNPGDGDEDSFMGKLTANPAYLGIAAGGAVVLLIVALIGIFGRWGA